MSKKESDKKLINKPKESSENSSTPINEEDSTLSHDSTDESNLTTTNSNPSLKLTTKLDNREAIKTQKDNLLDAQRFISISDLIKQSSKEFSNRVSNLNLGKFLSKENRAKSDVSESIKQSSKEQTNLNSSKQCKENIKRQSKSTKLSSKQPRISNNLRRAIRRNTMKTKTNARTPRNSINELVEMMLHFNLTPLSSNQQTGRTHLSINPNLTTSNNSPTISITPSTMTTNPMFGTSHLNEPSIRQNTRRLFSYQQNVPSSSQQPFSPNYPNYPNVQSTNFNSRPLSSSIYQINPYLNRQELVDLQVLTIIEQITALLDRFLEILNEFREQIVELDNLETMINRSVLNENTAQIIDAITNVLPERLGERFGNEIERSLAKHFGDKKVNRQNKF